MKKEVTILTGDPTIEVIAEMQLNGPGILGMANWVAQHRPECMPDDWNGTDIHALFPHDEGVGARGEAVTENELLVELAGRKCYDSFGLKAGKKTNAEYIANTQGGAIPHASILYHAKMSFFFAGISRRVSHEIIRNYVGADRDEEGAPSQESTRFTHHYGFFIAPPRYLEKDGITSFPDEPYEGPMFQRLNKFRFAMKQSYAAYLDIVAFEVEMFEQKHGEPPKAMDRKRIYEAASSFLPHQAETSFIWTTNPAAIAKLCRERCDNASDLEIQRFAKKLKRVSVERWPNLFPQVWMKT